MNVWCMADASPFPLTDRISETRSQGCNNLESPVKCLDHGESNTLCNHARLCWAARCIECIKVHVESFIYTHGRRVANFESC